MSRRDSQIPRRPVGAEVALSLAQERLWYSHLLAPESPVYNRPLALRLAGPLDPDALRLAFDDVARRHEVLTSAFVADAEGSVRVRAGEHPAWAYVDLDTTPPELRNNAAQTLAAREAKRPFALATGPVARALLVRVSDHEHLLALTFHHIVFDGWSAGVLVRELAACYSARAARVLPALPDLPVQHADFVVWQRSPSHADHIARQVEYWREQLAGVRGLLDLPTDRARRLPRSFDAAHCIITLPAALADSIREVGRRQRATLYMTLLAAFGVSLRGYTGEDDIVIGSPAAGRGRTELEGLIGCFINTVPVRVDLRGDPTFTALLERVRNAALGAFAHLDVPLQEIVKAAAPERDPNRPPLFQVLFNMRNLPRHAVEFSGLNVGVVEVDTGTSAVELSLEVAPDPEGLRVTMEFSTDLFEAATIERMLRHYLHVLEAIAAGEGSARISSIPIMSSDDRAAVLRSGAGTRATREPVCVHELVERSAQGTPDAVAISFGAQHLTYHELDRYADSLAARLREASVRPGTTVGVFLRRSPELLVAMLAVLKAGGAYLPLDPEYPTERLAWMLQDCSPGVVLTRADLVAQLPAHTRALIVDMVDEDAGATWRAARETGASSEDPAYVIYTSGSSGRPRGVIVPHRAVVNHNLGVIDAFGLKPTDRVLQFASPSFDASVEEIFPTWMAGATLVLRTDEMLGSAQALVRAIARQRISVLNLPTAFWHAWAQELARAGLELPEHLRLVVIGGEKASSAVYRTWRQLTRDGVALLNTYGPTEATVVASIWDPRVDAVAPDAELPIGRPIPNACLYVLDEMRRPVPFGVVGELYIGGPGVAHGYLNQPQLTSERFVADPFDSGPNARLFRTGDRARLHSNGLLEFVGRVDRQVKVRGFRIDPEEVEAALRAHADVHDAVVVLRQDAAQTSSLTAYVVPRAGDGFDSAAVRRWLRARLPDFMIPATVTTVQALPRDGSGKVDASALREGAATPKYDTLRKAQTDAEHKLVAIFREVLDLDRVAVTDDFFDLGGHSLLAIRLATRIEEAFARPFPLSMLLEGASVESLASRLDVPGPPSKHEALVPIQPRGGARPFFCVHEFFGDVLLYAPLAGQLAPDIPFYGLQATSLEDIESLSGLATLYIREIRTVQPRGPYALGGLCAGGLVALEMAQQLTAAGEAVELLTLFDTSAVPFSWRRRPAPLRAVLRGVPDWLQGFRQLTPAQRRQLVRLTLGRWDWRVNSNAVASRLREGGETGSRVIAGIARALGLSEDRRRVAAAFRRMLLDYTPKPYDGHVVLFRPSMQPLLDPQDELKGWRELARGGVEVRRVPGNHLAMLQEPHVRAVARQLRACLQLSPLAAAP